MKRINFHGIQRNQIIVIIVVSMLFAFGGLVFAAKHSNNNNAAVASNYGPLNFKNAAAGSAKSNSAETRVAPLDTPKANNSTKNSQSLEYIIEEEKLAHDVYQVMYEKWGSRVFGNIQKSETIHQNEVLTLLQSRSIADPRSNVIGEFKNQELQTLYDKLLEQGSQNVTEAFRVGVAIEELDISDLKIAIDSLDPADTDVKSTYKTLLNGSENHLTAFNRQLTR